MKRKATSTRFALTILILSVLFTLSALLLYLGRTPDPIPAEQETVPVYIYVTDTDASDTDVPSPTGWILREYEGRIGIFDQGGALIYLLETYVKTLPRADQALLREGIYTENEERLYSLIEDYTE